MHIITITFPFAVMSRNQADKMHWAQKREYRKLCETIIKLALRQDDGGAIEMPLARRLIMLTRYAPRELDPSNLVGGAKQMVDALKRCGLIKDDSRKWLDEEYEQVKCKTGDERTEIAVFVAA